MLPFIAGSLTFIGVSVDFPKSRLLFICGSGGGFFALPKSRFRKKNSEVDLCTSLVFLVLHIFLLKNISARNNCGDILPYFSHFLPP